MFTFDTSQLSLLIGQLFWPFIRMLALLSSAPVFKEKVISAKTKIGLGLLLTFLLSPSLPDTSIPLFSIAGLWLSIQQILIGLAMGLAMQLAFATVHFAGELAGLKMGLGFATFFDPASGMHMPVLGRLFNLLAILLFLAFDCHLWLISLLVDSFRILPVHFSPLNAQGFLILAKSGSMIFINGMILALPLVTIVLMLNVVLGILNRMAPQFSIFVIGFPLTLTIGILVISSSISTLAPFCEYLFTESFNRLNEIIRAMVHQP